MTTITIAFALVPGLTPLPGGVTQELAGWRAAFWLTLVLGAVTAAVAFRRLPETNTSAPQRLKPGATLSSYATVLADRVALTYAVTTGLLFAAMSAYFARHLPCSSDTLGSRPPNTGCIRRLRSPGSSSVASSHAALSEKYRRNA
ncbi:hypothetical protein [Candidatus Halocynthiibacter alkanivorans]|uniref:hypothetical protein n=1 Tax=Candidatus Halocynthiibacter alkanivorans TaxID=2267619 RepID=UPI000DF29757|nr:hypothetical protein [Candidatus Halocynthiibacter alkanivorans]